MVNSFHWLPYKYIENREQENQSYREGERERIIHGKTFNQKNGGRGRKRAKEKEKLKRDRKMKGIKMGIIRGGRKQKAYG